MAHAQLAACIAAHAPEPVVAVSPLVELLQARYGANLRAVLLYGSCLHSGDVHGLFDLYAVVDNYRDACHSRLAAGLNALLPPNVYYLEADLPAGQKVRAKYALLTLADFKEGVSPRWFHSYLWARFSQPTALAWVCDRDTAWEMYAAFAEAVCTFVSRSLPLVPEQWTVQDLWLTGLSWTYRAEFRPEQSGRQQQLFSSSKSYFTAVTPLALTELKLTAPLSGSAENQHDYHTEMTPSRRRRSRRAWRLRIVQGKVLSVLRLMKAASTFQGGVDYIIWKIERHSGVRMEASPFLRRHPLLALFCLSLRLYRRGGVR